MKVKEIRQKTEEEVKRIYSELCQKKQQLVFKVANKQCKNVRELREVKKTLARVLTIIKEKSQ